MKHFADYEIKQYRGGLTSLETPRPRSAQIMQVYSATEWEDDRKYAIYELHDKSRLVNPSTTVLFYVWISCIYVGDTYNNSNNHNLVVRERVYKFLYNRETKEIYELAWGYKDRPNCERGCEIAKHFKASPHDAEFIIMHTSAIKMLDELVDEYVTLLLNEGKK